MSQLTQTFATTAPLRIRLDRAITVRSLAILGVVGFHVFTGAQGSDSPAAEPAASGFASLAAAVCAAITAVAPRLEQLVTVFFLISGYFAFRAYQRSQTGDTPRSRIHFVKFFVWRRFWRMVPAFWVALLFSYFVTFDHPFTWDGLRKLTVNASLLKTLVPGYFFSINYSHWYIAVQWQLDLLYPLFLFLIARRSVGFATALAWTASITLLFIIPQFTHAAFFRYFPLRWSAEWSLGIFLADRHLAGVRVFPRPYWTAAGAAVVVALSRQVDVLFLEWLAIRLFVGACYEGLLLSRSRRRNWERALAPIGICSYSLYLLHMPVLDLVKGAMVRLGADFNSFGAAIVFAAVSGVAAYLLARLSTEFVENKMAALGNRLWRRRSLMRRWLRSPRTHLLEPIHWCKKQQAAVVAP